MTSPLNPVHGIDYLNDHYEVLGIPKDADMDTITSAYREKIKQTHPDVVSQASDSIKEKARRDSEPIMLAYDTLIDPEQREAYDAKLAEFDPKYISKDGNPLINLGAMTIDLDFLIRDGDWEEKDLFLKNALIMSGFDESTFKLLEKQFDEAGEPSAELRSAYREMLKKKELYLMLVEEAEWQGAGVTNPEKPDRILNADDFYGKREELIEKVRDELSDGVEERVLALTNGEAPMLLTDGKKELTPEYIKEHALAITDALKERVEQSFNKRVKGLEQIARERADVLGELAQVSEWEYLPKNQELFDNVLVILDYDNNVFQQNAYMLLEDTIIVIPAEADFTNLTMDELRTEGMDELQKLVDLGQNVILLHYDPDIDADLQVVGAFTQHFNRFEGHT